jgi:hypothetical protein
MGEWRGFKQAKNELREERFGLAKAVSALRSATAVQNLAELAAAVRYSARVVLRVLSLYPWIVRRDN